MGVKEYTILQSSYKQDALTLKKVPFSLWKTRIKGFNTLQKAIVTVLASVFAFGFVGFIYFFITKGF